MKNKLAIAIITISLIIGFGLATSAAAVTNVGYVDFEFLFNVHPEFDAKNEELQMRAEALTREFEVKAAQLNDETEVERLSQEYEGKINDVINELTASLIASVHRFIKAVADENQIGVVLPNDAIIYGGVDLTGQVVEAMYGAYGISVPSYIQSLLAN